MTRDEMREYAALHDGDAEYWAKRMNEAYLSPPVIDLDAEIQQLREDKARLEERVAELEYQLEPYL